MKLRFDNYVVDILLARQALGLRQMSGTLLNVDVRMPGLDETVMDSRLSETIFSYQSPPKMLWYLEPLNHQT